MPAPIPALWATKKYYATPFLKNNTTTIDFRKAGLTNEYISRFVIRVSGNVTVTGGAAGAATGNDNPEGLLQTAVLTVSPTPGNLIPFNQVSGRGLKWLKAINKEKFNAYTALTDTATVQPVFWEYEFIFKRNHVRKNIEYGLDMSRYTSVSLNLTFGDQNIIFTGSTRAWDFSGLVVELWADVGYNVNPEGIHATETFDLTFPVTANGDLLINQLPAGVLYTDLYIFAEQAGVLVDGVINNIDIEGGGRNWTFAGDNNAPQVRDFLSLDCFDGSVSRANVAGTYLFRMRDGTFLRSIDALQSQILIKVNITGFAANQQVRVVGKKMVPYGVKARSVANSGTKTATGKR